MHENDMMEFKLSVGERVIGLICHTKDYVRSLEEYFGAMDRSAKSDIRIKLNLKDFNEQVTVPDSLFTTKTVKENSFTIFNDLITGSYSRETRTGEINVKSGVTYGELTRVFEQILYQAYYSADLSDEINSLLIHSSGVIYKDSAFLFAGSSGRGKSTIAELSGEHLVLNDEICLVNFKEEVYLQSTPFNGYYKDKKKGKAKLKAIFLISHGKEHSIDDIKKSNAVKLIAREMVPPIGLDEMLKPGIFIKMIDLAEKLYDSVPVKELKFTPDPGFWKIIEDEFLN